MGRAASATLGRGADTWTWRQSPPMKQVKHPDRLELRAQALVGSSYTLSTRSPLSTVLRAGYFSSKHPEAGLRKGDVIRCICSYDDDECSITELGVVRVVKKDVVLKQL